MSNPSPKSDANDTLLAKLLLKKEPTERIHSEISEPHPVDNFSSSPFLVHQNKEHESTESSHGNVPRIPDNFNLSLKFDYDSRPVSLEKTKCFPQDRNNPILDKNMACPNLPSSVPNSFLSPSPVCKECPPVNLESFRPVPPRRAPEVPRNYLDCCKVYRYPVPVSRPPPPFPTFFRPPMPLNTNACINFPPSKQCCVDFNPNRFHHSANQGILNRPIIQNRFVSPVPYSGFPQNNFIPCTVANCSKSFGQMPALSFMHQSHCEDLDIKPHHLNNQSNFSPM